MRELMEDLEGGGEDPVTRARAAQRAPRMKRFYTTVTTGPAEDGGFVILLDGKSVRTPARGLLRAPTQALASAMAEEWAAQESEIEPSSMPLTRLVNVALDRVTPEAAAVREEVASYTGTDMLFYRAEGPDSLVRRQAAHWDPVLAVFADRHGARFFLAEGIRHVAQPPEALAAAAALIPQDPLLLAAVHSMTTLTGSALLALALAGGHLDADAAWAAAHVDEDFNREQWGEDEIASARRSARRIEMDAAARLVALLA